MTDSTILHLEDLEKRYFSYFFNTLILSGDIYDQLYCCRTRWFYRCNTPLSYRINSRLWNHPVSRQNIFYQYHWLHCYRSRCFACLKRLSSKSKACSFFKDWNLWRIYYIFHFRTGIDNADKEWTSECGFSLHDTKRSCRSRYNFCNRVSSEMIFLHTTILFESNPIRPSA